MMRFQPRFNAVNDSLLAIAVITTSLTAAPTHAAQPSFDCATVQTPREVAVCSDAGLAAADRDMTAAWQAAIAHLDGATAKALRKDQENFITDLDYGFVGTVWLKEEPPKGRALREAIARIKRSTDPGQPDALTQLGAQIRQRTAFLRALAPADPAAPYAGLWKNNDTELLAEPAGDGAYDVTYGMSAYGWSKYYCHFTAHFMAAGIDLLAKSAHPTDGDSNGDVATNLRLARNGATLVLDDDPNASNGDKPITPCPHHPNLNAPLFHTGLRAEQGHHLDPDTDD